ncbi:hypothetical protein Tco_0829601 [Tanacetum coccineum]
MPSTKMMMMKTESDEVIKSNVEDLVPILSESEGISDDTCDVPFCDNSPSFDVLNNHFEIFFNFNNDCTSSDDDSFENVDYIEASPPDSELVSLEEVKDDILRKKLLNINLLIAKIESLNDNPTPDCVLKSPSPFPVLVEDSDSFCNISHFQPWDGLGRRRGLLIFSFNPPTSYGFLLGGLGFPSIPSIQALILRSSKVTQGFCKLGFGFSKD